MNTDYIATDVALRERSLRMEARKLTVESLVCVHLDSVGGTRQLVLGHQRLMFTLSLGALAGVITLFAAALRLGGPQMLPLPPLPAGLALLALTASALLSAATLQDATRQASRFLREPFPGAGPDLARLFGPAGGDATAIVAGLVDVLDRRVQAEPVVESSIWWTTSLLSVGVVATVAAFAV